MSLASGVFEAYASFLLAVVGLVADALALAVLAAGLLGSLLAALPAH